MLMLFMAEDESHIGQHAEKARCGQVALRRKGA